MARDLTLLFNIMNTILPETPKIGKSILAKDCLSGVKAPFQLGFWRRGRRGCLNGVCNILFDKLSARIDS